VNEHCYYRLNIETDGAINKFWKWPIPTTDYGIWYPTARAIFSQDWLEYTKELGIDFGHALLFYRGPWATSREAHVDTESRTHEYVNFALNWVIGGKDSSMHWFKMPTGDKATTVKDSKTNVPYTTFQFRDLEHIESCEITDTVTLVKTNLPHSITMGSEPRWCISARVAKHKNQPWDEIVDTMRLKNLLVERYE
jgi:hypothetical protein